MFQTRDKATKTDLNEVEIVVYLVEFKITIINMLTEVRRAMNKVRISTERYKRLKSTQ